MRGEVEIWEGEKLLHKESNLLVNGASELIADIMTVSPSLSGIEDHATSSILDASNYTIQAISFGKDASAYQYNAHALPSRRNLLYDTTPSSEDGVPAEEIIHYEIEVCSVPELTLPTQYENLPSSIGHALSLTDTSITVNPSLRLYLATYCPGCTTEGPPDSLLGVSAGQDNWFCFSMYIKSPVPGSPFYPHPVTPTVSRLDSHFKLQILGKDYTNDGFLKSRSSIDSYWSTADFATISSLGVGFTADNRSISNGYSIEDWDAGGGCVDAGNGWYRIWTSVLAPVSAVSSIQGFLYPAGWESNPTGETSGGVYGFGFQLERGRWPTDLQFNHAFRANMWDLSAGVLNRDNAVMRIKDKGTVRVVPPLGTSSYVPTNYLSSPPNPNSTRLEDGNTAILETSSPIVKVSIGQNINVIPYRSQDNNQPVFFNLLPTNVDNGEEFMTLVNLQEWGNSLSGTGSIGPQAYYLGCYPEGSSTGGSNWRIVTDLTSSAAYDDFIVSGNYVSMFNSASSMDVSGFVTMIMSGSPNTTPNYLMSSTGSGLCVSGGHDPTNSGVVEYSVVIGSGDVGYSNFYGGIYNMGLWTIDMDKSLKAGNTPPYSFNPLNNPRQYKLFATKHLTKNLGFIQDYDDGDPNTDDAGTYHYKDLKIKWRLHFL